MKKIILIGLLGIVSLCNGADEPLALDPIDAYDSLEKIPKAAKEAYVIFRDITDIPEGLDYPELEVLDVSNNQISSIDPKVLKGLPKLKKLTVNYNPISDEVIADLQAHYPDLKIEADHIGAEYRKQDVAPYRTKGVRGRSSGE